MKNYLAYESGFFDTSEKEVLSLEKHGSYGKSTHKVNIAEVRRKWPIMDIVDMTIRKVPFKRNKGDSAVILAVKTRNGNFYAKRHNNSQHLYLEW